VLEQGGAVLVCQVWRRQRRNNDFDVDPKRKPIERVIVARSCRPRGLTPTGISNSNYIRVESFGLDEGSATSLAEEGNDRLRGGTRGLVAVVAYTTVRRMDDQLTRTA
jgi:hypothetical protein